MKLIVICNNRIDLQDNTLINFLDINYNKVNSLLNINLILLIFKQYNLLKFDFMCKNRLFNRSEIL